MHDFNFSKFVEDCIITQDVSLCWYIPRALEKNTYFLVVYL